MGMDFFFVTKISRFVLFFWSHSHAQACTEHAFFSHFWPKKPNFGGAAQLDQKPWITTMHMTWIWITIWTLGVFGVWLDDFVLFDFDWCYWRLGFQYSTKLLDP